MTFETSPKVCGWSSRTRWGRQECTDAILSPPRQVPVAFSNKVDPVTGGHSLQTGNPSFGVGSVITVSCTAGVQNFEVCDACCDKCFNQVVP